MRGLAILVAALLAGCSSGAPETSGSMAAPPDDGSQENATQDPVVPDPWGATMYVGDGDLLMEPPAEGTVGLEGMVVPTLTGDLGALRFLSDGWPTVAHVAPQTVTVTLVLQAEHGAHGNGIFDIAVWFGTTRGESAFAFTTTGALMPGQAEEVVFRLDLGQHPGIVLPAGESFTLRVADSYQPEGIGVNLLVGPDRSRVEFTLQNMTEDPFEAPQQDISSFSSQITGGTFLECPAAEDTMTFDVGPNASWVSLRVEGDHPANAPLDIDLDLLDGSTVLWHAGSPTPEEEILLAGPALEPYRGRELGARASICLGGYADYEITVAKG